MGNVMASQTVNPELIQLARQSRGLTQTKLASEIRVSQSLIAKYEAGVRDVPPDHLARLAEALDYPVRFFRRPMGRAGSGSEIFHRKRARVPASVLGRNYADAAIRRMEIDALREALDGVFKLTPFPFYPIEEFDYDPEKIARTVRAAWQLPEGPVFNVTRTVEENGGIVVAHKFDPRIDGFGCRTLGLPPVFHLNRDLPPDRWRWTLAHEIGHMVMHEESAHADKEAEDQAHRFAAEFLAPAHQIEPQLRRLNIGQLAPLKMQWKISMSSLVKRAKDLNTIDARQYKSLMVQLSQQGYRTREPVNLDPPLEHPSLLFDLAQYFEQSLEFSRTELLGLLNIGETDFWTYYRDPEDLLNEFLGPPTEGTQEEAMSEPVAELRLHAGAPSLHQQLRCAPEDVRADQQLLDALHLLQREGIVPERLIEVSEQRVRQRIEETQSRKRQVDDLDRLYGSDYQS